LWKLFEKACEEAWGHATLIDLAPFVPPCHEPLFLPVLIELIKIDLGYRWHHGSPITLEEYLARFPGLGSAEELPVELIHEEYRVRSRRSGGPSLESYRARFPRQFTELRRLIDADEERTQLPPRRLELPALLAGRFQLQRQLGSGAMGVVHRAYDQKEKRLVAVKTMRVVEGLALWLFKNEFRALARLRHRNLVSLHEMMIDRDHAFFTMELVVGCHLLTHVRQLPSTSDGAADAPTVVVPEGTVSPPRPSQASLSAHQLASLRQVFGQLAQGVQALHNAGKLHRDLKPSNVLVTPEGRVVLLDFGLAAELDRAGIYRTAARGLMGTPAYMAPEQAANLALSPATDWYAVGVMLFEALAGHLPFAGDQPQVLRAKLERDAPAPRDLVVDVPEDLNALVQSLLRRDPDARPDGAAILAALGVTADTEPSPVPRPSGPFVGRRQHLHLLKEAFQDVQRGNPVTVFVHGTSGAGKTALVQRFLDGLEPSQALVFKGRCYEQESVPHKALDGVMDALARHLRWRAAYEPLTLPRDIWELAKSFEVLKMVPGVTTARRRPTADEHEQRRRAVAALRELLDWLADYQPLVILIDDLQWGDTDSADLLLELTRPPDAPVLLLLACYRAEDADISPGLQALREAFRSGQSGESREVKVEPLTQAEAGELAQGLLTQAGADAPGRAELIARESGGNPFFVYELVQYFLAQPGDSTASEHQGPLRLGEVLWTRIGRLPDRTRRLLEVVAVAGRPLPVTEASAAAGWEGDDWNALTSLCAGPLLPLLRRTGPKESLLETYHDRIRETVVAHLSPTQRREHHRRLAEVLREAGSGDFEVLAVHYREAGQDEAAIEFSVLAADKAAGALAFEQAVRLYRQALELAPEVGTSEQRRRLRVRLGESLANAGRGTEAAGEFLAAVEGAAPAEQRELRHRAAIHLLMTGQVDEGLAVVKQVLQSVRLAMADAPWQILLDIAWRDKWVKWRGLRFRERPAAQVSPETLAQIDVCNAAAWGLLLIEPFRGFAFQLRGLLLALKAGEPVYLARTLIAEAAYRAANGTRSRKERAAVLRAAQPLVTRLNDPYLSALLLGTEAGAAGAEGNWVECCRLSDLAEHSLRDSGSSLGWELIIVHSFALQALWFRGDLAELNRHLNRLLKESEGREELYTLRNHSFTSRALVRLAADEPDRARAELIQVPPWQAPRPYHVQHLLRLATECFVDLYRGQAELARERLEQQRRAVDQSQLLEAQSLRILMDYVWGSCFAAAALRAARPGPLWAEVRRRQRRLREEKAGWATAFGLTLEAALAWGQKDQSGTVQGLEAAVAAFRNSAMSLHEAAALRRLGQLRGDAGRRELVLGDRLMMQRGVKNLDRMTALLAAGFPDP
jgi:serine/threonine protein kinase